MKLIKLILINALAVAIGKTDILLDGINYNLSPLKILYYLMNDMKSKHKLTD